MEEPVEVPAIKSQEIDKILDRTPPSLFGEFRGWLKDIVLFWYPKDPSKSFIKRVVGVPGDLVSIREGQVYINGAPLNERYVPKGYQDLDSYPAVKVKEGH